MNTLKLEFESCGTVKLARNAQTKELVVINIIYGRNAILFTF